MLVIPVVLVGICQKFQKMKRSSAAIFVPSVSNVAFLYLTLTCTSDLGVKYINRNLIKSLISCYVHSMCFLRLYF